MPETATVDGSPAPKEGCNGQRVGSRNVQLYSITTNQAAIINLFRVINRYVGNLTPMPGVFPDHPAPVIRNTTSPHWRW